MVGQTKIFLYQRILISDRLWERFPLLFKSFDQQAEYILTVLGGFQIGIPVGMSARKFWEAHHIRLIFT